MITTDRRAIAIHEAGHALVLYLYSIPIVSVAIVSDGYCDGRVTLTQAGVMRLNEICDKSYENTSRPLSETLAEVRHYMELVDSGKTEEADRILDAVAARAVDPDEEERIIDGHCIALFAGSAALAKYTRKPMSECMDSEGQSDRDGLIDCVVRWMGGWNPQIPDYLGDMRQRALDLVAYPAYWRAIETLADVLERDNAIDGETAYRIFAHALPDRARPGARPGVWPATGDDEPAER